MEESMQVKINKLKHSEYISLVDYLTKNACITETSKPYILFELESINAVQEIPPKYEGLTILIAKPKYETHKTEWTKKVQGLSLLLTEFKHI